MKLSQKFPHL